MYGRFIHSNRVRIVVREKLKIVGIYNPVLNYGFPIQEQNTFKTLKISTNLNIQNKKIELI
jgi:hypothetical protein